MFSLMMFMLIAATISLLLLMIPLFMMNMMVKWMNKLSSMECGMNQTTYTRKPFSLRFFLLMILFIIFDLEIILLLIIPTLIPWTLQMVTFLIMFITLLLNGLIYEWTEGSLNWKM